MVCASVRLIIPSIKLEDYLSVQAHKPCSISHLVFFLYFNKPLFQCFIRTKYINNDLLAAFSDLRSMSVYLKFSELLMFKMTYEFELMIWVL